MAKIKITQKRNNSTEITFSGELTIFFAMELYQEHLQRIKLKPKVIIKLSSVTKFTTLGCQIFLYCLKKLQRKTANIKYQA